MPVSKFTDEERQEVCRRYLAGGSINGIAAELKICKRKVSAIINGAGILRQSPEVNAAQVVALYRAGVSQKEISRQLKTCAKKVATILSENIDSDELEFLREKKLRTARASANSRKKAKTAERQKQNAKEALKAWDKPWRPSCEWLEANGAKGFGSWMGKLSPSDRNSTWEELTSLPSAYRTTGIQIAYDGITYPSIQALGAALGISAIMVLKRLKKGWCIEDAVRTAEFHEPDDSNTVEYKGKRYLYGDLSKICGLPSRLIAKRHRNRGWDIERAMFTPANAHRKTYEWDGKEFDSIKELAEYTQLPLRLLNKRICNLGWPVERAVTEDVGAWRQWIEWKGERRLLAEVATEHGTNCRLVVKRMARGWSLEKAVTTPASEFAAQVEYKGETYSVAALARLPEAVVSSNTISLRLKAGWDVEKALTTQVRKGDGPNTKYEIWGEVFNSSYEVAADPRCVVSRTTFINRVSKTGWDVQRAAETPMVEWAKKREQRKQKCAINIQRVKDLLNGLREHVVALSPRDIYILLQQHDLNNLPKEEGGLLVHRLIGGTLPPDLIRDWIDGTEDEPPAPPTPTQRKRNEPPAVDGGDVPGVDGGDQPAPPAAGDPPSTPTPPTKRNPEPGDESPDLPTVTAEDALKLLTSHAWATDDAEAAEALICSNLDKVWNHAYSDEQAAVEQVRAFQGNSWTDELRNRFLSVYNRAKQLQIPAHYVFPHQPRLMQLVAAAEAAERRRLLILSGMGLGKTLAALLATQAAGCGLVWVVCPNNAIDQWERAIAEQWHHIEVRKKVINPQWRSTGPRILLLNFERFSRLADQQIAELIGDSCPDAFVIDEVQFAKQRTDEFQSTRRQQLAKCIQLAGDYRPDLMVLGMSGTPILNNLMEGRKLIELVFAEDRADLHTDTNIHNAMRMFQEFTRLGIRQRGADIWPVEIHTTDLDASNLLDELREVKRQHGHLAAYEQVLLKAKLPTITQLCTAKPTVIVTEFVEGIVEPIRDALVTEGLRVGVFTGQNKHALYGPYADALEEFKAGATDVLIGSADCMGTGIDGLQHRCCQMVFATLPWTDAELQQVIARLARHGQEHEVDVHIPLSGLSYITRKGELAEWSFCAWRWSVIGSKRALASCAVDGVSPGQDDRLTSQKALRYIEGWLERLGNDTVIARYGRPIRVPLVFTTETEELTARRRYGDFSACNARWGNANSAATHARLNANPQEWELYHTDLAAHRKDWLVDPLQEVIKHCRTTKGMTIGDFGCGTAELADAVRGRHKVHSFDHIAINDGVTACDIGQGVPLEDECLDLAVFSLSLMGSNWRDYLAEVYRCLKPTGQLIIWHPANQSSADLMPAALQRAGFKAIESVERYKWLHIWAVRIPNAVDLVRM